MCEKSSRSLARRDADAAEEIGRGASIGREAVVKEPGGGKTGARGARWRPRAREAERAIDGVVGRRFVRESGGCGAIGGGLWSVCVERLAARVCMCVRACVLLVLMFY